MSVLSWIASEPFRIFFPTGILFGIAGVMLWPLFFQGSLSFYPGESHARLMIQAFGGAFVLGFLGTAGPRVLGAPHLTWPEAALLLGLHVTGGLSHLHGWSRAGDLLFLAALCLFVAALGTRFFRFRQESPPPSLLLAGVGLLCGISGTFIWCFPPLFPSIGAHRFAALLLYQGFLLAPVMGVGIFLFPRLMGNSFGEPGPGKPRKAARRHTILAAVALVGSFVLEALGHPAMGGVLRAASFLCAMASVKWKQSRKTMGSLGNALRFCCIPLFAAGLTAPVIWPQHRVAMLHLLFVGGFGLVCMIAASRVLHGHSGQPEGFSKTSWIVRILVTGVVVAATTRATADFLGDKVVSHYQYAAWSWIAASVLWACWHSRRFFRRDDS